MFTGDDCFSHSKRRMLTQCPNNHHLWSRKQNEKINPFLFLKCLHESFPYIQFLNSNSGHYLYLEKSSLFAHKD